MEDAFHHMINIKYHFTIHCIKRTPSSLCLYYTSLS